MDSIRTFTDQDGARWEAAIVSHGKTSDYLNRRVHRPVLQFRPLDGGGPRRYVGYASNELGPIEDLGEKDLRALLARAAVH